MSQILNPVETLTNSVSSNKSESKFEDLPIAMLTFRSNQKHR